MEPTPERQPAGWQRLPRWVRMPFVAMVGATVVATGIALLVLPGPGLLVIALGVGILATEFAWARHTMRQGHAGVKRLLHHPRIARATPKQFQGFIHGYVGKPEQSNQDDALDPNGDEADRRAEHGERQDHADERHAR